VFIAEWKRFGRAADDTALQRNYKWSTANIYITYFRGIPLGALSDTHQLQIFPTRTIRGDIIACQLQGCTTGTDCRDLSKFHLANRCYYWW
jgi:hypothetical protein